MSPSKIEWTDSTWNPVLGCSRVSEGCRNCYAERLSARNFPAHRSPTTGKAFARFTDSGPRWTGKVELLPGRLDQPLRWQKPRRVFVNSLSDLFHEDLANEEIAAVFGVMASCPQHTFQVLTKRPARAGEWFRWHADTLSGGRAAKYGAAMVGFTAQKAIPARKSELVYSRFEGVRWPLPNVWLGVSVEDQETADDRIPLLLQCPAAVRFLSCEPLLGPVDLGMAAQGLVEDDEGAPYPGTLNWVIVGGESGPGARPCHVEWVRDIRDQCREAGVACFIKQLGASVLGGRPWLRPNGRWVEMEERPGWAHPVLNDPKGGNWDEWPEDLRVREFPEVPP